MGGGSWSASDWQDHSTKASSRTVDQNFTNKVGTSTALNPHGVRVRESRDSVDHPESHALIVALDVTGSMGRIANQIASKDLGVVFQEILTRKPIPDPQLMFMGVGDANCDHSPLQVSQFESDNRIVGQLTDLHLEGGGGGNNSESYHFPWYFAAFHTSNDCFEKRGKKGYLFTLGDEEVPDPLTRDQIRQFVGDEAERDYTAAELLDLASRTYHVFHLMIEEGSHFRTHGDRVVRSWTDLMGQRAVRVADHTKLAEIIVSLVQVTEGADKVAVANSWSGDTSVVVRRAVENLPVGHAAVGAVVKF